MDRQQSETTGQLRSLTEWRKADPITRYQWLLHHDCVSIETLAVVLQQVQEAQGAVGPTGGREMRYTESIPDIIHFLEEQRRSAVADLHAHQKAHRGPFAGTIPCFMDSNGTCHGIGEQIAENADRAIEAHTWALRGMNVVARYAVNGRE